MSTKRTQREIKREVDMRVNLVHAQLPSCAVDVKDENARADFEENALLGIHART